MDTTIRSEKWRNIVRWVYVAKRQSDKKVGSELFIKILRKIPMISLQGERLYILQHFKEYQKRSSTD